MAEPLRQGTVATATGNGAESEILELGPLLIRSGNDAGNGYRHGCQGVKDTGNDAAQRFLEWCQEAGIGGRQLWPVIAWEYHQHLFATGDAPVSARQLQRGLGAICPKGVARVKPEDKHLLHRLRRLLTANGWAVEAGDDSADPRVRTTYRRPSVWQLYDNGNQND